MQIRIDDAVYEKLKALADKGSRTIGGQIDYMIKESPDQKLLDRLDSIEGKLYDIELLLEAPPEEKNISLATPTGMKKITPVFANTKPPVVTDYPAFAENEDACCENSTRPCKHWIWDGLTQTYRNTLSGREKHVE